ncbi:hypothetical protein D3C81_1923240 [compost metagenome]
MGRCRMLTRASTGGLVVWAEAGASPQFPRRLRRYNHAVIWVAGGWRLSPMYDVLPMLEEGPAQTLAMAVGREGSQISRANLLSHHAHFALTRDQAEQVRCGCSAERVRTV